MNLDCFKFSDTYNIGASYIMQDGTFLNLEEQRPLLDHPYRNNHVMLDNCVAEHGLVEHWRKDCMTEYCNAIKLNDGTILVQERAYILLPKESPTEKQYKSLENWLYYIMTLTDEIQVTRKLQTKHYKFLTIKDENGYLPEDIIKEIRKLYLSA